MKGMMKGVRFPKVKCPECGKLVAVSKNRMRRHQKPGVPTFTNYSQCSGSRMEVSRC